MKPPEESAYIAVATADGAGSGRLLAAALRDALDGGARLIAVQDAEVVPRSSQQAVDFVFASDDAATDEVIRAGMNPAAQVVFAQLLRCPKRSHAATSFDPGALRAALQDGGAIAKVRWQPHRGPRRALELVVRIDQPVTLTLSGT